MKLARIYIYMCVCFCRKLIAAWSDWHEPAFVLEKLGLRTGSHVFRYKVICMINYESECFYKYCVSALKINRSIKLFWEFYEYHIKFPVWTFLKTTLFWKISWTSAVEYTVYILTKLNFNFLFCINIVISGIIIIITINKYLYFIWTKWNIIIIHSYSQKHVIDSPVSLAGVAHGCSGILLVVSFSLTHVTKTHS